MPCLVSCFLFELVHGNVTEWCKTMSNHWILCNIGNDMGLYYLQCYYILFTV
jgi:hypothetical protein